MSISKFDLNVTEFLSIQFSEKKKSSKKVIITLEDSDLEERFLGQ